MSDLVMLPAIDLHPHPGNPRKDVGDVSELAESIRAQGIRQNLLVVPTHETAILDGHPQYRVVIGHRRLAAAKIAGLTEVPCVIADLSEREQRELMIVENSQRSDLTAIEEADAYQGLLDLGMSKTDIATRTGRSTSYVRSRLKAASIPMETRAKAVNFGQLSINTLEAIAEFDGDTKTQDRLVRVAGGDNWEWELNRARQEAHRSKWLRDARAFINVEGLPMMPDSVKLPHNIWEGVRGYERVADYDPDGDGTFEAQWRSHHFKGQLLAEISGDIVAYRPVAAIRPTEMELESRRLKAEQREREKPVRQFADTSRDLRLAWLSTNRHRIGAPLTETLMALASEDLLGYSPYMLGHSGGADFEDRLINAYNAISAIPLPVTGKDTAHGVYHLGTPENLAELRRRALENPRTELLLLLAARREASVEWTDWANDTTPLRDYYTHLKALGYPVSDEEQAALDGKYQEDES